MEDKLKPTDIDIENMTTPTKEQIEKIKKKIIKDRIKFLKSIGYTPTEIGLCIEEPYVEDDIKIAITEWEKIRNSPK